MDAGLAIRAVDLGKQFLRGGWEPHRGMRTLVDRALRAPVELFRRSLDDVPPRATTHFWALRGVSFEIPRGQVTGLVGPNGAGKSVLLRILSRVTQPSAGFAEVRGRVGVILQGGAAFHPELTGHQNLRLSGILFGMQREEVQRKLRDIVAFAEVEPFLDTPLKHYSSGMLVRLALGVAVHLECDVLLLDESLATGDEAFRTKCIQTIHSLAAEGRTVVFVSHDPALLSQICQRCLYIEGGRLIDDGPTTEILSRYGTRTRLAAQRMPPRTPGAGPSHP